MSLRRVQGELEGLFWQLTGPLRARLRELRATLSIARWRMSPPPRTLAFRVAPRRERSGMPLAPRAMPTTPAIAAHLAAGAEAAAWTAWLAGQSESSWSFASETSPAGWSLTLAGSPPDSLPATALESLLLAGESAALDWVAIGAGRNALHLLRSPGGAAPGPRLGRWLEIPLRNRPSEMSAMPAIPGLPAMPANSARTTRGTPWTIAGDTWLLGEPPASGVIHPPVRRVRHRLPAHPAMAAQTAILLLPFVAVGGAERLLLDFAAHLPAGKRLVVVTTDGHRPELGDRLAELERLAPVFTLGELLARERQLDALATLIERYHATSLACWNGCTLFYDSVVELRRSFPHLRLVNQYFDHRAGWIRRLTPAQRRAIDCQIAVNPMIARELEEARGVPPERIALVRHGIREPEADAGGAHAAATAEKRRHALRAELGIPTDVPVIATFIRLHEQKRPLDVLRLARRFAPEEARFLLIGGGPLTGAIDAELAREPIPQLARRPLEANPDRWFDAVDLCLLTSAYEGLPLFLLEGMIRGIPAVATAVGEIPDLLLAGGGLTAPVGDLDRLERALRALLDPSVRQIAGEIARRTVLERHALPRFVAETAAAIFGPAA
ncbi:MAG: glycosyltransferase family 4 protein [Thermoanaerobaculia bacterium]